MPWVELTQYVLLLNVSFESLKKNCLLAGSIRFIQNTNETESTVILSTIRTFFKDYIKCIVEYKYSILIEIEWDRISRINKILVTSINRTSKYGQKWDKLTRRIEIKIVIRLAKRSKFRQVKWDWKINIEFSLFSDAGAFFSNESYFSISPMILAQLYSEHFIFILGSHGGVCINVQYYTVWPQAFIL